MEFYVLFTADRRDWRRMDARGVAELLVESQYQIADIVPADSGLPLEKLRTTRDCAVQGAVLEVKESIKCLTSNAG